MISVKGFISLADAYDMLRVEISRKLKGRLEPFVNTPERHEHLKLLDRNIEYLVRRVIGGHARDKSNQGIPAKILLDNRQLLDADPRLLHDRSFYGHIGEFWQDQSKEERRRRHKVLDTVGMLYEDFWVDAFLNNFVKESPLGAGTRFAGYSPFGVSLLHWRTGTINMDRLRDLHQHMRTWKGYTSGSEDEEFEDVPARLQSFKTSLEEDVSAFLAAFDYLHGKQVFLPEEWFQPVNTGRSLAAAQSSYSSPKEAILAIRDSQPYLNKAEIRQEVIAAFPLLSVRRFNSIWDQASQENEALRIPGRKRKPADSM